MLKEGDSRPEGTKPGFFYGYVIVLAAFFIMALVWGVYYAFGIFLKPLSNEFGWSRAMVSAAWSPSNLLYGLFSMVTGRLNDKSGPRVVVAICGFLLGLGYLLMSQVSAIWQVYLFLGITVGIGLSGSYAPLTSTAARWFVKRRGIATGIIVSGVGFGGLIGPPVANWLIYVYGWRTSYVILGIAVFVLIILVGQFLRRDPGQMRQVAYGVNEVKAEGLNSQAEGFSFHEAIRARQFWLLCIAWLCSGFIGIASVVHVVPHATDLGISQTTAANILASLSGLGIIGRIMMGSVGDRIGNKSAMIISFALMSAALFWLLVAREMWMLYLFAIIFGFSFGGSITVMPVLAAELFGLSSLGAILGVVLVNWGVGATIGPVLVGHMFDITGSYQIGFLLCAALSVIGLILFLLLRPTAKEVGINGSERNA